MIKKMSLILLMFIFMITSVFASSWSDFGNTGYFAPGYDGYFFSSAYTGGNSNFSILSDAIINKYLPIVTKPLDEESSYLNFIYTFTSSSINVFSGEDFSLISTNSFPNICGQPILMNYLNDADLELAFISGNATHKMLNIVEMQNNELLVLEKNISILAGNNPCVIENAHPSNNGYIAYMLTNPKRIYLVNLTSLAQPYFPYTLTFGNVNQYDTSSPYFSKPMEITNIDSDAQAEVILASQPSTTISLEIYDRKTGNLQSSGTATTSTTQNEIIQTAVIQLGIITGNKEIFVNTHEFGNNDEINIIFDTGANILFQEKGSGFNEQHLGIIGDVNFDNLNEYCYIKDDTTDNFICVDALFNKIINITWNFNNHNFMAMAEYNNASNSSYMELITSDGLYRIDDDNSTLNLTQLIDFSSYNFNENTMFYTVSLRSTLFFTKDILAVSNVSLVGFYSEGVGVVCGDGICSIGESILTCPDDCLNLQNLSNIGEICNNSNDCLSGKCLYGLCTLKNNGESCLNDYECVSGDCKINGKCAKASLWQQIDKTKDETAGDDVNTNNFISILITIVITFAVILLGAKSGAGVVSIFAGGFVFIILSFFFTIVGWLSGWILLGVILMMLAVIIIMVILGLSKGA